MTMKQKKRIRAAVLTLLFLLLAIGTFDSRHGNLAAQAESRDLASDGNMNFWRAEANLPGERLVTAQVPPEIGEGNGVFAAKEIVKKPAELKVEVPVELAAEVEKIVKVVDHAQVPIKVKSTPPPDFSGKGEKGPVSEKKPDTVPEPDPKPDSDPGPDPGLEPDPGDDFDPGDDGDENKGHDNDEIGYEPDPGDKSGTGAEGDRNKGHGNDGDGYDEDNRGRGGFGGVGSSRGQSGHGRTGGSGGRGNSGGRGGSRGRG